MAVLRRQAQPALHEHECTPQTDTMRSDDLDFENATNADPDRNMSHSAWKASDG
jgi:hypothetical protein